MELENVILSEMACNSTQQILFSLPMFIGLNWFLTDYSDSAFYDTQKVKSCFNPLKKCWLIGNWRAGKKSPPTGVDFKFLRNMHFAKKHKKDLRKMQ
ncbi:hypothetical protein STEG23_030874, partial [Scotinomys teguina]